ncbi:MAG: hypothetical protein HYR49_04960 [Gammaproteobacteria bacterium]|nr:hypothetical protein [Gammaproteobacteria bacterium]
MPEPGSGMNSMALSFQNAPPFSVPMRFFLTAPLFAILAAVPLLGVGELPLSRWQPAVIAATHFLVLGFMTMVMVGALFQLIPVLCGGVIPRPRLIAGCVHAALTAGALLLPFGLFSHQPFPIYAGASALAIGLLVFVLVACVALHRAPGRGPSVGNIRLSLISLFVTVCLGVYIAAQHAGNPWVQAGVHGAEVHLAWGLIGWAGLLLIGVAYQVVPMFQITPAYPASLQRYLGPVIFGALLVWSAQLVTPLAGPLLEPAATVLAGALLIFAGTTLWLQSRRRRRVADVTLAFWRLGMGSLALASLLWLLRDLIAPSAAAFPALGLAWGILAIAGCLQAVICGMLYKIVPFLAWLQLQQAGVKGAKMHEFIAAGGAQWQLRLHWLSVLLLLVTLAWPRGAVPAALIFAANFALLQYNLLRAAHTWLVRLRGGTGLVQRAPNSGHL